MKNYLQTARTFIVDHKKQFIIGGGVVLGVAIIVLGVALFIYNKPDAPKIVYEPARACDLLTLAEAKEFLGDATINGVATNPVQTGDITVSQCGYSDGKIDTAHAVVAAISVRSGINDAGIAQNKAQFANGKPTNAETVSNIGDSAYFNAASGQLNILKESTWIILSYGSGADPASNTLDDAVKLAQKVLNQE